MITCDVQDKGLHPDQEFPLSIFSQSNVNGYGPSEVWELELLHTQLYFTKFPAKHRKHRKQTNENGKSISAALYTMPLTCGQLCNERC